MVAVFMPLALAQDNSPLVVVSSNVTACETYTWSIDGQTYTSSTVATHLSDNSDTLFVLNLTVNHVYSSTQTLNSELCSYEWRGQYYFHSGTYTDTVLGNSTLGTCDSFFMALITIPSTETINSSEHACGSFTWHGNTYTESGVYADTNIINNPDLTTCTHIDRLSLFIVETLYVSEDVSHCGNYSWYSTWCNKLLYGI